jgi:hypothetical protein
MTWKIPKPKISSLWNFDVLHWITILDSFIIAYWQLLPCALFLLALVNICKSLAMPMLITSNWWSLVLNNTGRKRIYENTQFNVLYVQCMVQTLTRYFPQNVKKKFWKCVNLTPYTVHYEIHFKTETLMYVQWSKNTIFSFKTKIIKQLYTRPSQI